MGLHFDSVKFLNQWMIFLNFNRLSYDKTIENSENEPATLVLYLELKNRNRERHEEYLVKIIFKLKYEKKNILKCWNFLGVWLEQIFRRTWRPGGPAFRILYANILWSSQRNYFTHVRKETRKIKSNLTNHKSILFIDFLIMYFIHVPIFLVN